MGILLDWSRSIACAAVFFYGVVPLVLFLFPAIQRNLVFMSAVKWPFTNYSDPRIHGVKYESRNFYLTSEPGVRLGCWHVLPKAMYRGDQLTAERDDAEFEQLLSQSGYPIVVYMHGNTWTRAAGHRIPLYNIFSELNVHVVALDYRGFADSSGFPSEEGVNRDVHTLYRYVKKHAGDNPIFLWGHSLGTAIATRLAEEICITHKDHAESSDHRARLSGLVLEAPFNNLAEIIRHHPFTYMFRWLPWFEATIVRPCTAQGLHFNTDERIRNVCVPIMILHAKDDRIIPFHLAKSLHTVALDAARDSRFVEFDHPHNYGHKYMVNAPELPDIFYEFMQHCLSAAGAN